MEHASATPAWAMFAYLVAGVLFILALRGLSSPESSRSGNRYGMVGMLIAVVTTIVTHDLANIAEIGIAIAIGGAIGNIVAQRIAMTAMPQLVAAFHSLVGLAAVLVACACSSDCSGLPPASAFSSARCIAPKSTSWAMGWNERATSRPIA